MSMVTLTWFQLVQLLGIAVMVLILPTLVKVTKDSEARGREARRQDEEELAAIIRSQHR